MKPHFAQATHPWNNVFLGDPLMQVVHLNDRWVYGEGKKAYVHLRVWNPGAPNPEAPSKRVALRGDEAWVVDQKKGADGVDYAQITVPRRGVKTSGWVPASALREEHPLIDLTLQLNDNAPLDPRDQRLDRIYDGRSCTNGAFLIQDWLRGYIGPRGEVLKKQGGPLSRPSEGGTGLADRLRRWGLEDKRISYYKKKDGKTLVSDPNDPVTWLWPGDLIVLSRPRYWNAKDSELEIVPLNKPLLYPTLFEGPDADLEPWTITWSGHIATLVKLEGTGGKYTSFQTLEAHTGSAETKGETYRLADILYWGMNHWGYVPVPGSRPPSGAAARKRYLEKAREKAKAAWEDEYWYYHQIAGESASDAAVKAAHLDKAKAIFQRECQRRGRPVRTPDEALALMNDHEDYRKWESGLEVFGFAYWLEA